jgi:hypothetical protein
MRNSFITLFILFFCTNFILAQRTADPFQILVDNGNISTTFINKNSKIEGSPYVVDKFSPAKISILGNKIYSVKYNAFHDEVAVLGDDNVLYSLRKDIRKDIFVTYIIQKKTYQIYSYLNNDGIQDSGFFIVMSNQNSNIKLLKKERIIFIGEKKSVSSYADSEPSQYKRISDKYFIKIGEENARILPRNKKEFSNLFPEYKKDIMTYIKSERIKLNNEKDLLKILSFLNSLNLS